MYTDDHCIWGLYSGLPQIIGCVAMALDLNWVDLEMVVKIIRNSMFTQTDYR